jgi:hypothetical protein
LGKSIEARVAIGSVLDPLMRLFPDAQGNRCVANSLGQIDASDLFTLDGHGANLGLLDARAFDTKRKNHNFPF